MARTFIARFTIPDADDETWTTEDVAVALDRKFARPFVAAGAIKRGNEVDSTVWTVEDFVADIAEWDEAHGTGLGILHALRRVVES